MSTQDHVETAARPPLWRNLDTIAIVVLLLLTAVVMWQRWVFDNWLARHDLLTFFLPWLGALGDRLAAFDVPALNPYIFSGSPFAGDPESGWMFLPAMILFPFFEVTVAYKLMVLFLLVLAGTSTYAFARLIGYSVLAALFSAVAFEFGPYLFGQTDCCTVGTKASAFLPMAFIGVELAIRAKSWPIRLTGWVLSGLAISQIFSGWLGQGIINALLLIAAWLVFRTLITPPERSWSIRDRLVRLFTTGPAIVVIGLLLGAAALLPRLAANAESNNAGGTYETTPGASDGTFHSLSYALRTTMSDALGFRGSSLWGPVIVMMVLAVYLMRRNSTTPFFALISFVIPALAIGVPIVTDVLYIFPMYENIHVHSPGRVFWLYPFFASMLAGGGFNELRRLSVLRGGWVIAIAPLVPIFVAYEYVRYQTDTVLGDWLWISAILTTLFLVVIAVTPTSIRPVARSRVIHGAGIAIVALTFVLPNGLDLGRVLRQEDPPKGELVMWGNDEWMQDLIHESLRRDDPGRAGEFLQKQQLLHQPFRFIAYGGIYHPDTVYRSYAQRRLEPAMVAILQNSRAMRLELETTQGYNPLQPLVYQEFIHELNGREQDYHVANLLYTGVESPLIDLLNVRYIVVDRNIPETREDHEALAETRTEVYRDQNAIIYESPTVLPRAWMVYDVRTEADQEGLGQLASGEEDGARVAYVKGDAPEVRSPEEGDEPSVVVSAWTPDVMTLDVSQSGSGLLVVSEVYSENWKATIDGEAVDVLQTDHALLGIPVDAGDHTIELRYDPDSLTLGLWISGITGVGSIGILGLGIWSITPWRRRRWSGPLYTDRG